MPAPFSSPWKNATALAVCIIVTFLAPALAQQQALIAGYKFGSSSRFPGNCATPPAGQTRTVAINASFPDTFGRTTQGWGDPARKPTGDLSRAGHHRHCHRAVGPRRPGLSNPRRRAFLGSLQAA